MTWKPVKPVLLCGGAGTRLWPESRAILGKPFATFFGDQTLLGSTLKRVSDSEVFREPMIVCNKEHGFLVSDELQSQGIRSALAILEPEGRNTAPAITAAALQLASNDPDALLLVLPSDHDIGDVGAFVSAVRTASAAAQGGWLMTFGIKPTRPETGYGYIRLQGSLPGATGCFQIERFVEKPDARTAQSYLDEGTYLWNSGMFLFSAKRLLEEMERYAPKVVSAARSAIASAKRDPGFLHLDGSAYGKAPDISIDYALMEKTQYAGVVPVDFEWTDVGTWDALWQISDKDKSGNAIVGDVIAEDTTGSYLRSDKRLLTTLGVQDLTVIAKEDTVLVCPRDRAQDVRLLVSRLADAGRTEHLQHSNVRKPWGSFEALDGGAGFRVERLVLKPGASVSPQESQPCIKHWVVVKGRAEVTCGSEVLALETGASATIPERDKHSLRNTGSEPLQVIEIRCGNTEHEENNEAPSAAHAMPSPIG